MIKELTEDIGMELQDISIELNVIQSLARVLNQAINDNSNLKYFDIDNLSNLLTEKIIDIESQFESIIERLEI